MGERNQLINPALLMSEFEQWHEYYAKQDSEYARGKRDLAKAAIGMLRQQRVVHPYRRAHWVTVGLQDVVCKARYLERCSRCAFEYWRDEDYSGHKFCPACGSRMREKNETDEV